jgi:predicted phosphoribosyltransferase
MAALFRDRADAGRSLAQTLEHVDLGDAVVVGLARGGVAVAAEVASALALPLDALAVRKVGYPRQPEYGIGAVAPGSGGVYVRTSEDLDDEQLRSVVERATEEAQELDAVLHSAHPRLSLDGKTAVLVDDGLATGATMVAAVRWSRARGARRAVVAVPVGAFETAELLRGEADGVVCLYEQQRFGAVGFWYAAFDQLTDEDVIALLAASRG